MNALELVKKVTYAFLTHEGSAKKPSKAFRKWDGKTPYGVHPVWCATTLLHETSIPEDLRNEGAEALLFHDILEDTTAKLPDGTSDRIGKLVEGMTFEGGTTQEMQEVWSRSKEIRLLKLYDKVSNLLDAEIWMTPEKLAAYRAYTRKLADDVTSNYGTLNIVRLARALTL